MTKEIALGYWAARLREALGEPVRTVILTRHGPRTAIGMPTLTEMASGLGMSVTQMGERMARQDVTPWDVALEYVGGDESCEFYRGPV